MYLSVVTCHTDIKFSRSYILAVRLADIGIAWKQQISVPELSLTPTQDIPLCFAFERSYTFKHFEQLLYTFKHFEQLSVTQHLNIEI